MNAKTKTDADRAYEEALAMTIGFGLVAYFAIRTAPWLLAGAFVGCLVGGGIPWSFRDQAERAYFKGLAKWSIGAGLATTVAYLALRSPLGVDAEAQRFERQWTEGGVNLAALVDHPWAWVPLAGAAALIVAGIASYWRASK